MQFTRPTTDEFGDPIPSDTELNDGRVFKKSGNPIYPLPNDKSEYIRLNTQHYLLRYQLQCNYLSPVTNDLERGIKVLDVGCGTGIWSIDLAREFPNSTFIGTDIIDIFANETSTIPPNCSFLKADTFKGLPFPDGSFDFVFQRAQSMCFTAEMWPRVLREIVRVTKPGGYIELLEGSFPRNGGPATTRQVDWLLTFSCFRGVNDQFMSDPSVLSEAGIQNVVTATDMWRLGWDPDHALGEALAKNYVTVSRATRPLITAALGIGNDEYEETVQEIEEELSYRNNENRATMYIWRHYGRK
ncbi:methyltransferase type 11 [Jimgerdemannia flammicorona]|uniref:Methyltransferase type 11 n=1 Tax=Jimgerdemannia flammicorona TaxID=994334 RepID=A0A433QUH8_9FUNG|nr:methyltransferase type 11 [Jimgerdemannia flammicorona]